MYNDEDKEDIISHSKLLETTIPPRNRIIPRRAYSCYTYDTSRCLTTDTPSPMCISQCSHHPIRSATHGQSGDLRRLSIPRTVPSPWRRRPPRPVAAPGPARVQENGTACRGPPGNPTRTVPGCPVMESIGEAPDLRVAQLIACGPVALQIRRCRVLIA